MTTSRRAFDRRWKDSFFGDLHAHGRDGIEFYTEKKVVITRWPKV